MSSAIQDAAVAGAVDAMASSLDLLQADVQRWEPTSCDEAMVRIREFEALARRMHAAQLELQQQIDRSGVHQGDGHASAKVMVRHGANLSTAEALRRERSVRMLRAMPEVAAGHALGLIGAPQVDRITRVFTNLRVREQLIEADGDLSVLAARLPYRRFDTALTDWERLADEDGAGDAAQRARARRRLRMPREYDGSRRIEGECGSVEGQILEDIWQRQVRLEWAADWAEARARLGDSATGTDLVRTAEQRNFDALLAVMLRGDEAIHGAEARTCTELVCDQVTFERNLAKLFGTDPGPDPRLATWWDDHLAAAQDDGSTDSDADGSGRTQAGGSDLIGFRCGTIDGHPLDPAEVAVVTLIGHTRRVVVGADGVVLDMGRKQRLFTGARQIAVRLAHGSCVWTGCEVPAGECQSDHVEAFNGPGRGSTDPGNGAPCCGRHNRFKERGFTLHRDQRGRWHVFRPDGTEIT